MVTITKSTKSVKQKEIERKWKLIDISKKPLGRITPEVSYYLQGKHKQNYVPYLDMGDNVVVVNAAKIKLTGKKEETKEYLNYSGYPGGLKRVSFKRMMEKDPRKVVKRAVSGMLPKNKHRDRRLARLFIFVDENHPYKDKFNKQ